LLLSVKHLSKSFGAFKAVDDLSFSVNEGEVYGFLGQNGAGKSTTIRMVLSLIEPTAGTIEIFGKTMDKDRSDILSNVGAVVEKPDLYRYLSGYENLSIFAKMSGKQVSRKEIHECLSLVGLSERSSDPVRVYSQGMKQRLGIAVALVHNPSLIILDEPTNGLDPQGIADIRNLIHLLSKERKKTIIVSSHLLAEIEQVADSMLIIHKGRKVVEGNVSSLVNPDHVQLEITTTDNEKALSILNESVWSVGLRPSSFQKILVNVAAREVPLITTHLVERGVGLSGLRSMNSLEAYFLSITSGNEV
jgi:ABC-type multidrug transport system ATPase subunit